jgi:hypothetical protein
VSAAVQLDAFAPQAPAPRVHRTHVRAHLRTVRNAQPTGAALKDKALTLPPSSAVAIALEYVRTKLAELYRSRASTWPKERTPYVNSDDAARLLREWAECPREIHHLGHQNWRGQIFRKGFTRTGTSSPALRKHMKGTDLPGWRAV